MNLTDKNRKFLDLFEPCRSKLSNYCRAIANDPDDAKDLMSEVVLKAFEGIEKLKDESAFPSYLFTIASRVQKRKKMERKDLFFFENEDLDTFVFKNNSEKSLEVEDLYKAISLLPYNQQEAIILFEISGFKLTEIASIQKATLSTVKSRVTRAREKLKEILIEGNIVLPDLEKGNKMEQIESIKNIKLGVANEKKMIN